HARSIRLVLPRPAAAWTISSRPRPARASASAAVISAVWASRSKRSDGDDTRALERPLDPLALRHLERAADDWAGLARVDDVVDQVVRGGDVDVDDLAEVLDELGLLGG